MPVLGQPKAENPKAKKAREKREADAKAKEAVERDSSTDEARRIISDQKQYLTSVAPLGKEAMSYAHLTTILLWMRAFPSFFDSESVSEVKTLQEQYTTAYDEALQKASSDLRNSIRAAYDKLSEKLSASSLVSSDIDASVVYAVMSALLLDLSDSMSLSAAQRLSRQLSQVKLESSRNEKNLMKSMEQAALAIKQALHSSASVPQPQEGETDANYSQRLLQYIESAKNDYSADLAKIPVESAEIKKQNEEILKLQQQLKSAQADAAQTQLQFQQTLLQEKEAHRLGESQNQRKVVELTKKLDDTQKQLNDAESRVRDTKSRLQIQKQAHEKKIKALQDLYSSARTKKTTPDVAGAIETALADAEKVDAANTSPPQVEATTPSEAEPTASSESSSDPQAAFALLNTEFAQYMALHREEMNRAQFKMKSNGVSRTDQFLTAIAKSCNTKEQYAAAASYFVNEDPFSQNISSAVDDIWSGKSDAKYQSIPKRTAFPAIFSDETQMRMVTEGKIQIIDSMKEMIKAGLHDFTTSDVSGIMDAFRCYLFQPQNYITSASTKLELRSLLQYGVDLPQDTNYAALKDVNIPSSLSLRAHFLRESAEAWQLEKTFEVATADIVKYLSDLTSSRYSECTKTMLSAINALCLLEPKKTTEYLRSSGIEGPTFVQFSIFMQLAQLCPSTLYYTNVPPWLSEAEVASLLKPSCVPLWRFFYIQACRSFAPVVTALEQLLLNIEAPPTMLAEKMFPVAINSYRFTEKDKVSDLIGCWPNPEILKETTTPTDPVVLFPQFFEASNSRPSPSALISLNFMLTNMSRLVNDYGLLSKVVLPGLFDWDKILLPILLSSNDGVIRPVGYRTKVSEQVPYDVYPIRRSVLLFVQGFGTRWQERLAYFIYGNQALSWRQVRELTKQVLTETQQLSPAEINDAKRYQADMKTIWRTYEQQFAADHSKTLKKTK